MSSGRGHGWRAGDGVVVRTPLLPLTMLVEWAADPDPRRYLATLLDDSAIDEAIFVASPSLHASLDAWRANPESAAGQRIERALVKYAARMAGRATPFGLFSAVSTGVLGRETAFELAPRSEYRRRTRLDNDYLFVLIGELMGSPEVRERLTLRPNTSLYAIGGRLRFAAANVEGKNRSYHLVSVEPTPYLEATLARAASGARIPELAAPLVDADVTIEEARGYIEELVQAQILVPELGVHITGPEPIDGMVAQLRADDVSGPAAQLDAVRTAIAEIDTAGLGNRAERYRAIATSLSALPAKVDLSRLFQVDLVKPAAITLGRRVVAELAQVTAQLARISSSGESFEPFRTAFLERWDQQEVPLAEVLDEESGIGFEMARGPGAEGSPLLAGLMIGGAGGGELTVPWRGFEARLHRKLATALAAGDSEIVLADADIDAMASGRKTRMPDAFAAMVRLEASADELARGEVAMLLEGTHGPSGGKLLGRFCHASRELEAIVAAHHAAEEALAPDAVFAEIVHLNEGRIGNILCRPVLRDHEIVFLGVSGAPSHRQIQLDDLTVSIRGDRIVLRSRRLGKEVIPRLTTAHNFRLRSLGVYRFLCALASQGVHNTHFSWGPLGGAPYLPRVRMGRVVLARATWNLFGPDVQPITTAVRELGKPGGSHAKVRSAVDALRATRKLPRFVVIASGDNELPIDFDNPLLVDAFADEVSGSGVVTLHELFPASDKLVVHGPEGRFSNQLIVTFTRNPDEATQTAADPGARRPVTLRRRFVPGSEWLYAKIYCGEATADRVLRDAIAPTVRDAIANGHADRWFFIRYDDRGSHVRVRLHGEPARLTANVLPALERSVAPLLEAGIVRSLSLDAYEREIERYGGDRGMELVEELFWHDSEAVLGIIELLDGDAGADARWRLAVRGVDSLLETLGLDADARHGVAVEARERLGREVSADAALWGRIGDRFSKERDALDVVLARDPARDAGHALQFGFELLARRDAAIAQVAAELRARDVGGELVPPLRELVWSLAHMHVNRLLHASQRTQEMVIYELLRRSYASRRARSKPVATKS